VRASQEPHALLGLILDTLPVALGDVYWMFGLGDWYRFTAVTRTVQVK
jgi:hypothetical protein